MISFVFSTKGLSCHLISENNLEPQEIILDMKGQNCLLTSASSFVPGFLSRLAQQKSLNKTFFFETKKKICCFLKHNFTTLGHQTLWNVRGNFVNLNHTNTVWSMLMMTILLMKLLISREMKN